MNKVGRDMIEGSASVEESSRSPQDILLFDPISPAWAKDLKSAVYSAPKVKVRFAQALEALARDREGRDEDTLLRHGVGLFILGRNDEALEVLGRVDPERPYARFFLGRALFKAGRVEEAKKTLEGALALTPEDHDVRVAYLELTASFKDPDLLEHELEMGRHIEGTSDWYYFLGLLQEMRGDHQGAIDSWDQALQLDPQHPKALFALARELDRRGEEEAALELYERAASLRPVYMEALMNLGVLYEDLGRYDEAARCFSMVLREDPTHWRARLYFRDADASRTMYYDEDQEKKEDRRNQILQIPISDFELSVRSRNCLAKMEIRTLGDLVKKTEQELLSYKNFGDTSLMEIKEILRQKGLRLGLGREEISSLETLD
ncbi:MAG TPA: tetratricopeptide repeat protein, partial [Planctomycetes bacterium]|nr:tetratricopeptide repeat protein [Planctomycetota bacterium]